MYHVIHLWLAPTQAQIIALAQTMETVNVARNEISAVAYFTGTFRLHALTEMCAEDSSARLGLSLAMAHRCVASVLAAYRGQRHTQQRFHPQMSIPYDRQTLEIEDQEQRALLWTVIGWQAMAFVARTPIPYDWSQPLLMQVRGSWAILLIVPALEGGELREGAG